MIIELVYRQNQWWVVVNDDPVAKFETVWDVNMRRAEREAKYHARRLAKIHGLKRVTPSPPREDYMPVAAWA